MLHFYNHSTPTNYWPALARRLHTLHAYNVPSQTQRNSAEQCCVCEFRRSAVLIHTLYVRDDDDDDDDEVWQRSEAAKQRRSPARVIKFLRHCECVFRVFGECARHSLSDSLGVRFGAALFSWTLCHSEG